MSYVDVIVNSTNQALLLDLGGLSKSISKAAGPALQSECSQSYPNGITFGELASTDGYGLKCQKVYHVSICAWDSEVADAKTVLNLVVSECLKRAHEDRVTSIAFPTLGCGFLGHPPDIVAHTMKECVENFEDTFKDTTLKQLFVVVFTKASDWRHVKQAFQHVFVNNERLTNERKTKTECMMAYNIPVADFSQTCIRERKNNSCRKVHVCGHQCGGFLDEPVCPPCMQTGCASRMEGQGGNDDCTICYTDPLSAAPVIELKCGHLYHLHCVKRVLESKWVGPRITFNFILCPLCKEPINHSKLSELLDPVQELYEDVKRKAMTRLQFEGLDKSDQVTNRSSTYYNNPAKFAMDRYCYYPCFKCKKAYFGGTVQCEGGADDRDIKLEDMICPACSGPQGAQVCSTHGTDFIEYKCRYCCTIAVFFCFGNTHFCNSCHNDNVRVSRMGDRLPKCPAGPSGQQLTGACPLGIQHPPNGTEFCIGCGLCANLHSF
ncbi:E3 ubiquitin-protein ligase MYCBP2-like isoform X2 [Mercenaria mercenaria]|uniref:E3 ubiquitin-protein ligase MYCBP2-like isoform X2 n=1 Tax=Mercenaria mercenaria TaxID=6596 RepID=UPI00234EC450|nr:E3 ubiquitin-protein ligase MYCBP2-like isoform X2 [Mercenaria mercenaria]